MFDGLGLLIGVTTCFGAAGCTSGTTSLF